MTLAQLQALATVHVRVNDPKQAKKAKPSEPGSGADLVALAGMRT